MAKASSAVLEMMREDSQKPPPKDKLDRLRQGVAELRKLEKQREKLEEDLAVNGTMINEMKTKTLVDLFDQAKVDNIGISGEGNEPPYETVVGWYYKANIGTPADPKVENYNKSIQYIQKQDPDLLKTTFEVQFGLKDTKRRQEFEKLLTSKKFSYSSSFGVPWNTLTAWLKNQIEVKKKSPRLDLLGATVERRVQVVRQKETKAEKAQKGLKTTTKGKK
jgi:hypothetical protein